MLKRIGWRARKLDWELPQLLVQFSSDSAYNSFEAAVASGSGEKAQETGEGAVALDKAVGRGGLLGIPGVVISQTDHASGGSANQ